MDYFSEHLFFSDPYNHLKLTRFLKNRPSRFDSGGNLLQHYAKNHPLWNVCCYLLYVTKMAGGRIRTAAFTSPPIPAI